MATVLLIFPLQGEVCEAQPPVPVVIRLEPEYSRAIYPEWKNFTVKNEAMDNIVKVEITHPEGFKPAEYRKPHGWKVNYNPVDRQIIFESTDFSKYCIPPCNEATFKVKFEEGPTEECSYTFMVTVSDIGGLGYTLQIKQHIDKTPPEVKIIHPKDEAKVIGEIWINATVEDVGKHKSGIDRVELWINGTYMGKMSYDSVRDIYWWYDIALWQNGAWYTVEVKAYDNSHPNGNEGSGTVEILWWEATEIAATPSFEYVKGPLIILRGVGFKHYTEVEIKFENEIVAKAKTNGLGRFEITFEVPEVPRGKYLISAKDPEGNYDEIYFQVRPYITSLEPWEGPPSTEVTVVGANFAAEVWVNIIYRDVHQGKVYWQWRSEWDGIHEMEWFPHLDDLLVATVKTDKKGSFSTTFHIPRSYGGLHPIYGIEKLTGIRSENALFFHVKPKIWVEPSEGLSEQYITIYAEGLPLPWNYSLIIDGKEIYMQRQWVLAIDFGPHKYWVWEENFILNNEFNSEWLVGLWNPISYYGTPTLTPPFPPEDTPAWSGTLSWRGVDMKYRIGSPFLKVPVLMHDEYEIKVYQFDKKEQVDVYEYAAVTKFTISTNPGVELSVILDRLDELEATIVGTVKDAKGEILIKIDTLLGTIEVGLEDIGATLVDIQGDLAIIDTKLGHLEEKIDNLNINITLTEIEGKIAKIESSLGAIETDVSNLDASVTSIEGRIVTITTSIGSIEEEIAKINGQIVSVQGDIVTIQTDIGKAKVSLEEINAQITATEDRLARIETDIGTIEGKITSIEGDVATIETEIGTIRTNVDNIEGLTSSIEGITATQQPITLIFALIAAITGVSVLGISVWKRKSK